MAKIWMILKNKKPQHIGNAYMGMDTVNLLKMAHKSNHCTLTCGVKGSDAVYLSDDKATLQDFIQDISHTTNIVRV